MLIKELRICDFLVFPREQVIELPTEGDSNLVVILAPNNTGKTNVIRALKFLFYGHLPDCREATNIDATVNDPIDGFGRNLQRVTRLGQSILERAFSGPLV